MLWRSFFSSSRSPSFHMCGDALAGWCEAKLYLQRLNEQEVTCEWKLMWMRKASEIIFLILMSLRLERFVTVFAEQVMYSCFWLFKGDLEGASQHCSFDLFFVNGRPFVETRNSPFDARILWKKSCSFWRDTNDDWFEWLEGNNGHGIHIIHISRARTLWNPSKIGAFEKACIPHLEGRMS